MSEGKQCPKIVVFGNGYGDKHFGDKAKLEIRYGEAEFSFWFPASKLERLQAAFNAAFVECQDAIDECKRESARPVAKEI